MSGSDLVPGTVFAGHLIVERLGSGGMGTVYKARHPRLPRQVALKVLRRPEDPDPGFRARFDREAELVARLDHPNIVDVYDRGVTEAGVAWVSMRFLPGGDVAALLRRERRGLEPRRAVHIVTETAKGLDHAHAHGIVHRDVKPANIFLGTEGRVLIGDFGIARSTDTAATVTADGVLLTAAYAAPERVAGGPGDPRADVYALGVTLYQLLTGRLPDAAGSSSRRLPPGLGAVVAKATAADPGDRYPSCGALAAAAAAALRRGRPAALRLAGTGAVALTVITAVILWATVGPRSIAPVARVPLAMVPIPGDRALFCPVPYLKSDRGPVSMCTEYLREGADDKARHGYYYPLTHTWEPGAAFTRLEWKDHYESQPDGGVFVGGGFVVHEGTGVVSAGHYYDAHREHGQFTRMVWAGPQRFSAIMRVCPGDLSRC
ncbi:serine/threonine-protein kinase [Nocardia sp. NPDC127526]|uniref:serine/threonine-protein kinase n=1 Tax=Nocardia sp. NPDC127526 TaxID=3345393 RepID=UPI0036287C3E